MSFYDTVEERFKDWNYVHPLILASFVRSLKPQVIVECGLYRGFAACHMAHSLQQNNTGKLIAIDNFSLKEHVDRYGDPRTHAEENIKACGVDQWIEIHEGETSDPAMWPDKVDFCYVDAWHSYQACVSDCMMAIERGATFLAMDDTENCVGPRMTADWLASGLDWQRLDIHSDNGMVIFMKGQQRRPITFSQELPLPNPGVDLRPLSLGEQYKHFAEASAITGIDYSSILEHTEHDLVL